MSKDGIYNKKLNKIKCDDYIEIVKEYRLNIQTMEFKRLKKRKNKVVQYKKKKNWLFNKMSMSYGMICYQCTCYDNFICTNTKSVNYKKEPDDVYICKDFVLYE